MQKLLLFLLLIIFGNLCAQTISNVNVEYSCPCKVTATYTLTTAQATDVLLYYSADNITWLPAETFPERSPGTHTDIWDCDAAGVLYGQFYFKLEVVKRCSEPTTINMPMIFVEGGTFTLGAAVQPDNDGAGNNGAVGNAHLVTLSNFCMAETPVTQVQFTAVMGVNPSEFQGGVYAPSENKPVEYVNWYDALVFCNKLSLMESKTPVYSVKVDDVEIDWSNLVYAAIPTSNNTDWNAATMDLSANGYRLPTEAEWEYAARGGNQSLTAQGSGPDYFYSGSNTANDVGWYHGNNGTSGTATYGTKQVRKKQPNALGLYDMSGNVSEWCWDFSSGWGSSYYFCVMRGGNWFEDTEYMRVSRHDAVQTYFRYCLWGFRVACSSQ